MYEFTMKNGQYVAMFEGGHTIVVMTVAEVAKTPASKLAEAFEKVMQSFPEQRTDGYIIWPEIGRTRRELGFAPRPLAYS